MAKSRRPPAKKAGNRWVFPAVLAGIVVVGIVAVILAAGGDDGGGDSNAVSEVSAEVRVDGATLADYSASGRDAAVGQPAPQLGSIDFQGENLNVGGTTGEPYALVFLAHWCPHCQAEVPRLVSVADNGRIEGVKVIGVATGTSNQQPNYPPSKWLDREDWPFPVLLDDADGSAGDAYGLTGYPFMVFVDAEGKVVGRLSGEVGEEDLTRIFRALAQGQALPLPGAGASSRG